MSDVMLALMGAEVHGFPGFGGAKTPKTFSEAVTANTAYNAAKAPEEQVVLPWANESEMLADRDVYLEKKAARAAVAEDRQAMKASFFSLPPYLIGAFYDAFIAINQLLDLGLYDAAAEKLMSLEATSNLDTQDKLDAFASSKADFLSRLQGLKATASGP